MNTHHTGNGPQLLMIDCDIRTGRIVKLNPPHLYHRGFVDGGVAWAWVLLRPVIFPTIPEDMPTYVPLEILHPFQMNYFGCVLINADEYPGPLRRGDF